MTKHIFREYDIRGVAERDLTSDVVERIGRGIAELIGRSVGRAPRLAVGRDCRLSGPRIHAALTKGLQAGGAQLLDVGVGPTPALYFGVHHLETDGGVMITGSHNAAPDNGFKIMIGHGSFFGGAIQELRALVDGPALPDKPGGSITPTPIDDAYVATLTRGIKLGRKPKVVLDAGNGGGGPLGLKALAAMGITPTALYCEMDGNFPNHHPDPTVPKNLEALIARMKETDADLGIAWDGLVVATGLRPRRLTAPGPVAGRHVLRTVEDCHGLRIALGATRRRVVVIGAGFVGCEVAATLRSLGHEVRVVEPAGPPMGRVIGPDVAAGVQRHHEAAGVGFVVGAGVTAFTGDERVTGVVLDTGDILPADLVVEALVPNPDRKLLPGMFANIELNVGSQTLPSVPRASLVTRDEQSRLFVVAGGRIEERVVALGPSLGERVAVLRGVSPQDAVVVSDLQKLNANRVVFHPPDGHKADFDGRFFPGKIQNEGKLLAGLKQSIDTQTGALAGKVK